MPQKVKFSQHLLLGVRERASYRRLKSISESTASQFLELQVALSRASWRVKAATLGSLPTLAAATALELFQQQKLIAPVVNRSIARLESALKEHQLAFEEVRAFPQAYR